MIAQVLVAAGAGLGLCVLSFFALGGKVRVVPECPACGRPTTWRKVWAFISQKGRLCDYCSAEQIREDMRRR